MQWRYVSKWPFSSSECCQLRKIKWVKQIKQTRQTQWSCICKWFISCLNCCQLRKIKSVESNQANSSNSTKPFLWMIPLLPWRLLIEEDRISWIKSIKPAKLNEDSLQNDSLPAVNVVNCGRSKESDQMSQTSQSQWGYSIEWSLSWSECCQLRKIQWIQLLTIKLIKFNKDVSQKDSFPVVNVANCGRSNESKLQIQTSQS